MSTAARILESTHAQVLDRLNDAQRKAYWLLRNQILNALDNVECVLQRGNHFEDEVLLAVARNEIPLLTTALRGLIKDHQHDEDGHCRACGYRKVEERFERQTWPCPVVNSVYAYVKDELRFYQYMGELDPMYTG